PTGEDRGRVLEHGAGAHRVQRGLLPFDPCPDRGAQARTAQLQLLHLGDDVRNDALGGIGGGGGANVRGEVDQRGVDLVADRRDDRGPRARDQAGELLVREGQQVLERAAAAGDDDDVDLVEIVQLSQRRGDL